jgi:sensor histidine kinase regulating citrate/malate metabolism
VTARPEGKKLRLVDTATGEKLLWEEEVEIARRLAEARAVEEAVARRAAEEQAQALAEEVARLRRELKR